jgi:hypothetical protein
MAAVPGAERHSDGARTEYRRGPITEWYVNERRGLEQWFAIDQRPDGTGPFELTLRVEGGLTPDVQEGALGARFVDPDGRTILNYTGLRAWDADGDELTASLAAGCESLSILVDDTDATYPLTIDPTFWVETAKLLASDGATDQDFGSFLTLSGDTILVGASKADANYLPNSGAVYVYERNLGGPEAWGEVTMLAASDGGATDRFGRALSLDGDTAVIGAFRATHNGLAKAGAAYIVERDQGGAENWGEVTKITASDASPTALFGISADLSGDTAVIGAMRAGKTAGAAYVFERNLGGPDAWGEADIVMASDAAAGDGFGVSVDIDDDTFVVGAFKDDHKAGLNSGSAYVFVRSGSLWQEQAILRGSDLLPQDRFGNSVAISGDTIVVAAFLHNLGPIANTGAAYVFTRSGAVWTEEARLTASAPVADDRLGRAVAIDGDRIGAGAYLDDLKGVTNLGSVYMYLRSGTTWTQEAIVTGGDIGFFFNFGLDVEIDGETVAVGSTGIDSTGNFIVGSAYVFEECCDPTVTYCTAGTSANGCQATLSATGSPSFSSPSGFDLTATGVAGAQDGTFFFGTNGRKAVSWGNGTSYFCVVVPVARAGILTGTGTSGACDGTFTQDLNAHWCWTCPASVTNPGAGTTVQAQLWYRDPFNTSNQTTSLSDAIEFTLTP